MREPQIWLVLLFAIGLGGAPALALSADEVNRAGVPRELRKASTRLDPAIVKAQVLLARQGFSPGAIDGRDGENYRKAIMRFRLQAGLGPGDRMDQNVWRALGGETATDIVTAYTVTEADRAYDFARRIPRDFARQARMRRLAYTSAQEMFAERFRMSDGLLLALNPRANFRQEGSVLAVLSAGRPLPPEPVLRIDTDKRNSMVIAYGPNDRVLGSYPATIGSDSTPSPEGEYTVARIIRDPTYHYDPKKNFQQERNTRPLVLPRGPNNPVGTVWIGLSRPTFGIHGAPDPSRIGKTSSHGCIRLTNWDAQELAAMVKPGVTVRFVE